MILLDKLKSFGATKIMLVIGFVIIIVIIATVIVKKSINKTDTHPQSTAQTSLTPDDGMQLSNNQCKGQGKPQLTSLPMNLADFGFIIPYGLTAGGHVTPIDHQYFSPTIFKSPRDTYEVKAMADATIVDIQPRTNERGTEYRLVFSMSCKFFYYYDLVTSLSPDIKAIYDQSGGRGRVNIPVKSGQLIGRIGGQTLDFAVWDMDVTLKGFIVPDHYKGEVWKIHTADPLNYYTDDVKAQALSKYIRTVEPVSGKIDYDVDGKLVGNWFLEGSGGYAPNFQTQDYFKTHLSIAFDLYDPTSIVFSIGDFGGQPMQFGVKGNSPDPKDVSIDTGLVKYELVQQDWADPKTGSKWDRDSLVKGIIAKNSDRVQGVALVKMLEDRKVQVEVFPGKSASEVSGFSANAKVYER